MYTWKSSVTIGRKSRKKQRMLLQRMKKGDQLQPIHGILVEAIWMLSVHDIEGIGVGAHINEKEIKIEIKTGTQEEGKIGMKKDIIVIKEESKKYK